MDNLTKIVRTEISRQYKSVRQFSFAVDIPLSTINSALHNGVGGSSFDPVMQICKTLGIKAMADDAAFYLTDDTARRLRPAHDRRRHEGGIRPLHGDLRSLQRTHRLYERQYPRGGAGC